MSTDDFKDVLMEIDLDEFWLENITILLQGREYILFIPEMR
ncbi:MAG: hypothetical protein ACTSQP_18425 [Promethearchaeota archaeon]